MTVTGQTPPVSSAMTGSASFVPGATVTVAEGAAFLSSSEAVGAASSPDAAALMTRLDQRGVRNSDLLHLVSEPGGQRHRDVPRQRTDAVLRTVHRLVVVGLKLPAAGSGLCVGLQSVPVDGDGFQLLEGQISRRFGAVTPF